MFADTAAAYASAHAPRSQVSSEGSAAFPAFLATTETIPDHLRPFLADLARLERAVDEVYDAAPSPLLDSEVLPAIPEDRWADARLEPIAALRLLALDFPVNGYYERALTEGDSACTVIPGRMRCWLVVWRRNADQVWRADLDRWQYTLLASLDEGCTLGRALERCLALPGVVARELQAELSTWFADWTADGLFARVVLAGEEQ
jgi:hypothetical protein